MQIQRESSDQIKLITRINQLYPTLAMLVTHIPSGGKRSLKTGVLLKAMGLKKGWPDLLVALVTKSHPGLFLEMKRKKSGRLSPDQIKIHQALREQGYQVECPQGVEEAWAIFEDYVDDV